MSQGRTKEAELLHRRAISLTESTLGEHHPNLSVILTGLADLLSSSQVRANTSQDGSRTSDIPSPVLNCIGLACFTACQGNYEEAETLYRRAMAITETSLGTNHPDLSARLADLAGLLMRQVRTPFHLNYLSPGIEGIVPSLEHKHFPPSCVSVQVPSGRDAVSSCDGDHGECGRRRHSSVRQMSGQSRWCTVGTCECQKESAFLSATLVTNPWFQVNQNFLVHGDGGLHHRVNFRVQHGLLNGFSGTSR